MICQSTQPSGEVRREAVGAAREIDEEIDALHDRLRGSDD